MLFVRYLILIRLPLLWNVFSGVPFMILVLGTAFGYVVAVQIGSWYRWWLKYIRSLPMTEAFSSRHLPVPCLYECQRSDAPKNFKTVCIVKIATLTNIC